MLTGACARIHSHKYTNTSTQKYVYAIINVRIPLIHILTLAHTHTCTITHIEKQILIAHKYERIHNTRTKTRTNAFKHSHILKRTSIKSYTYTHLFIKYT